MQCRHYDFWYPRLGQKGPKRQIRYGPYSGDAREAIDGSLKEAQGIDAMAKQWAHTFLEEGLNTTHVLHMPRGYATFQLMLSG